ncbi:transposase [Streptomyces janthinus]|uniref:Transposase n=1 Tax=Streptomyces violaceus TaxID=1936 RepID=A0ABY9UB12_STRVL|nr:transposase [Streptomyces janthinus]WND20069.1 transposase [Streptomyces janthinus]
MVVRSRCRIRDGDGTALGPRWQPASPTTTGKVERFHQTLRRELLDDCGAFESVGAAQAALDAWVEEYNSIRPHQALDMQSPAERFTPVAEQERDVLSLRVPGVLALVPQQRTEPAEPDPAEAGAAEPEAGPSPLPAGDGAAFEVDRTVNSHGLVGLGGRQVLAAEILGGRRVSVRIEGATLTFFDPSSRELLRVRPNPLTSGDVQRLHGLRPAGPPPRPRVEPVRVQRRVSAVGTVMVCRQVVSLGRPYAGQTVTVHVSDTTITVDLDGQIRVIRRTNDVPVRNVKANKPHGASHVV